MRRLGRKSILWASAVLLSAGWAWPTEGGQWDVLIRGGKIVDGSGNPWFYGDVAVQGERIAHVGRRLEGTAKRVIDAAGLVVAPGFIDLHNHSDDTLPVDSTAQSMVRQGVTMNMLGESRSVGPIGSEAALEPLKISMGRYGFQPDWTDMAGYFARLRKQGLGINVGTYVSYEQVRRSVLGYETRGANGEELEKMKRLVAEAMEFGAWGLVNALSGGGYKYPGEVLELARVVARYQGGYYSHIGSEGAHLMEEIDKAVRVAKETGTPVHIFHFKVRGKQRWGTVGQALARVEQARGEGLEVTANQYPYIAMQHPWINFFPEWAREGTQQDFVNRLKDPQTRQRIKADPVFQAYVEEHGGWEGIVATRVKQPQNKPLEGKRITEIAQIRKADPVEACFDLLVEEGGNIDGIHFTMSEEDVVTVMKTPWVAIASDGTALATEGPLSGGVPHPRSFGTNTRVLRKYVREDKVLTLEGAIRKMTSLPAQILGLRDRGQLRDGMAADLVIFDPNRVADRATFDKPKQYPEGVQFVLVNGSLVIDQGQLTSARPGQVLYGPGAKAGGRAN